MNVYTYYLHESSEKTPSFEIALFDALDPAMEHGRQLLKERSRYSAIEITRGEDSIARLTRDAL